MAVTAFSVGEKVFGYNEGPFGAHAQYLAVPEDASIATMPANLSYVEAAPSTEGAHYALAPRSAGPRSPVGQDVLVDRRDGSHRLGGGPVAEKPRCSGDRGLRARISWTWSSGPGR